MEIEKILPPQEGKNGFWRGFKNRRTRFCKKIIAISGVNLDLLGPYQPERLNEKALKEDAKV